MPLVLAPTGYTRMLHPDGEIGAARSAFRHGLPYTLSTMATTGIEQLRASVGGGTGSAGTESTGTESAGTEIAGTESAGAGGGSAATGAGAGWTGSCGSSSI